MNKHQSLHQQNKKMLKSLHHSKIIQHQSLHHQRTIMRKSMHHSKVIQPLSMHNKKMIINKCLLNHQQIKHKFLKQHKNWTNQISTQRFNFNRQVITLHRLFLRQNGNKTLNKVNILICLHIFKKINFWHHKLISLISDPNKILSPNLDSLHMKLKQIWHLLWINKIKWLLHKESLQ